MNTGPFDYQRPTALADAVALLGSTEGARPIAGGHSLLPVMKLRQAHPSLLVDLRGIDELAGITAGNGSVSIGATTTHAEVAGSDVIRGNCAVLAEAAAMIGDPQVRNMGTMGGSVAHADPAADLPPVLTALGAAIEVTGADGARSVSASEFFVDMFTTSRRDDEIVTAVEVPTLAAGRSGAYLKHRHPASSYAVVGVAAIVTVTDGVCSDATIVVGGVSGSPVTCVEAGTALEGKPPGAEAFAEAASLVAGALASPIGDVYASGEYRVHLAGVLTKRALAQATA